MKATLYIGVVLAATVLNAVVEGQPQTSFNGGIIIIYLVELYILVVYNVPCIYVE